MKTALSSTAPTDHLLVATLWIRDVLLGSVATTVAIIAVATVGLAMLNGRVDVRRGMTIVIGCFVLFGAPVIATGLLRVAPGQPMAAPAPPPPRPLPTPASTPTAYDPYAGAAVPRAR